MKSWDKGELRVKGQYLFNGTVPFFWLGDTAWRLFQCLNFEQSYKYLKNRHDKGYNVIQAVLIAHVRYTDEREGRTPLLDSDMNAFLSKENEPYWKHVESVVELAGDMGIYMMLLPVWGNYAKGGFLNSNNALIYMKFLTERFNKYDNIIWSLGGDIRGDEHYDMWDACGKYLKEFSPGKLVGFHPFGRTSSSYWFNDCKWLDFNMFQSGHRRYDQRNLNEWDETSSNEPWHGEDSYLYVEADLSKNPLRPVLDGEPSYEQIPQGLHDGTQPYWQEHHIRRYAWWPVLAGACGHTYGDNAVMQMYGMGTPPAFSVKNTWEEALHHAGSGQMAFLKDLMIEMDFVNCKPLMQLIKGEAGEKEDALLAFGNEKNIVVYNYSGRKFCLKASKKFNAWWYDPASGIRSFLGLTDLSPGHNFCPPVKKYGHNDWALILKNI